MSTLAERLAAVQSVLDQQDSVTTAENECGNAASSHPPSQPSHSRSSSRDKDVDDNGATRPVHPFVIDPALECGTPSSNSGADPFLLTSPRQRPRDGDDFDALTSPAKRARTVQHQAFASTLANKLELCDDAKVILYNDCKVSLSFPLHTGQQLADGMNAQLSVFQLMLTIRAHQLSLPVARSTTPEVPPDSDTAVSFIASIHYKVRFLEVAA